MRQMPEGISQGPMPRAFDCPHCGAYARQYYGDTYWFDGNKPDNPRTSGTPITNVNHMNELNHFNLYKCESCQKYSIYVQKELVYPKQSQAPEPIDEMPDDVRRDYDEARLIVEDSPRAAAALLRLAIEKLVGQLGADGDSLHAQIGNLVEESRIHPRVQKALDSVRVIGNESVHPGVMDMADDRATARSLFKLVNMIVDETLGRERSIEEVYETLPEEKFEGIENRDS